MLFIYCKLQLGWVGSWE